MGNRQTRLLLGLVRIQWGDDGHLLPLLRGEMDEDSGHTGCGGGGQLGEVCGWVQRRLGVIDAGLAVALPQEERPKNEEGGGSRRKVRVGGDGTHCRVHPSLGASLWGRGISSRALCLSDLVPWESGHQLDHPLSPGGDGVRRPAPLKPPMGAGT